MHYTKPALGYNQQIERLEGRGLVIDDRDRLMRWLKRVGYYRLSAYFIPFRVPGSDDFKPNTTFDQIIQLYKFDCQLRLLFMQAIDRVEVAIRSTITYQFAHKLGPFGYADPANFAATYDHKEFMSTLKHEEKRGSELFVKHYRLKYHLEPFLPVWMVTELISFGALSKLTQHLRASIRKEIAREYGLPESVFISWMHTLSAIRNICAHHNRLWNRELPVPPVLPHDWAAKGIDNDRVYCVALMLKHLMGLVAPKHKWASRLKDSFAKYPSVNLQAMKFPVGWEDLEEWK